MPILYYHPSDEDQLVTPPPTTIGFDEDDHWWAGVSKCAATIALAASLAISAAQATQAAAVYSWHQDDPAGSLFGQYDEDFWQNPVAPVPATLYQRLPYLPDPEEIPAATLVVPLPIEDEYWQNPVAPVPPAVYQRLPLLPDPEELPAGALLGQPDEDYWQNPVCPVVWPQPLPAIQADDVIVAQPTAFWTDEDYWQNWAIPIPASNFLLLPYLYDSGELQTFVAPVPPKGLPRRFHTYITGAMK